MICRFCAGYPRSRRSKPTWNRPPPTASLHGGTQLNGNCFGFTSSHLWCLRIFLVFCSVVRCRIHYILIRSVSRRPILTLCIGDGGSELNAHNPANQLLWLIIFSSEAQARGDLVRDGRFMITTCLKGLVGDF